MNDESINTAVSTLANKACEITSEPDELVAIFCGLLLHATRSFEISDEHAVDLFKKMTSSNGGTAPRQH